MPKFIIEVELEGYDTEQEMIDACCPLQFQ